MFGVSLGEAIFLPVAPDLLLVPLVLAEPRRRSHFIALALLGTLLGATGGYLIGEFFMNTLGEMLIQYLDFTRELAHARGFFQRFHGTAILIASFLPLPFKIFTLLSGAFHLPVPSFLLAIFIGRVARFSLMTRFFLKMRSTPPATEGNDPSPRL